MSIKQAAGIAIGLVVLAFVFSYVYLNFTGDGVSGNSVLRTATDVSVPMVKKVVTPDTATDAIISQAGDDETALDNAESDELGNVNDSSNNVNDLNTVYDDQTAQ